MEYCFPAIFRVDAEDKNFINVSFPDIPGAVTFGEGMEEARFMAKDVLVAMEEYVKVTTPSTLEKVQKNFPDDIIEMVKVEL